MLATVGKGDCCWVLIRSCGSTKPETLNCQIDITPHVSFYTSPFDAAFTGGKSYKSDITENES